MQLELTAALLPCLRRALQVSERASAISVSVGREGKEPSLYWRPCASYELGSHGYYLSWISRTASVPLSSSHLHLSMGQYSRVLGRFHGIVEVTIQLTLEGLGLRTA